jgi:hypothetical protein
MVNLDDAGPLVTLGGMALLGSSQKGRRFTGGASGKALLAGSFAGSSAEFVVDEGRNMLGIQENTLSDELAQVLLGAGVSYAGRMWDVPLSSSMASGIMINAGINSFQEAGLTLGQLSNGGSGGNGGNGGTQSIRSSPGTQNMKHQYNGRSSGGQVF